MNSFTELRQAQLRAGGRFCSAGGCWGPVRFGDPAGEYAALNRGSAVQDRTGRALLEIAGADRAAWLHNLTTNQVIGVPAGEVRYMFACDVRGRILFDLHLIVHPESLWLDLDRRCLPTALRHLGKYLIHEEVEVIDRSDEHARLAVSGPVARAFRVSGGDAPADLGTAEIAGARVAAFRHRLCGVPVVELFIPADTAGAAWDALLRQGACPAGLDAVQTRRIEAGIPWFGHDLGEQVLPAETGQLDRAVAFDKGCYLGQEVVERMRARGSLARRLVGVRSLSDEPLAAGAALMLGQIRIGQVTSACQSPAVGRSIGLAYVRAAHAEAGTELTASADTGQARVAVTSLPFA